jgi:hypothetical protein
MQRLEFRLEALIPSHEDFGGRFPQYNNHARSEGRVIFDLLMSPASLNSAMVATAMGHPAVAGIAESAVQEFLRRGKELTGFDKQFIGAVVCSLMEANGYEKTEKKRAIPHKAFTKGEVYAPAGPKTGLKSEESAENSPAAFA